MLKGNADEPTIPGAKKVRPGAIPQLPVGSFLDWDRVGEVSTAIRSFESGNLASAGMLADSMLGDDRINGVFSQRVGALVASNVDIDGARERRKEKKIAEILAGSDEQPGLWDRMHPPHAVSEFLYWGRLIGVAIAELVWDTSDPNLFTYTMRVWHPQFYRWNWQTERFYVQGRDADLIEMPSTEFGGRSDGKWMIWTPYGFRNWRRALIKPLATLYLARQWNMRDWSRYDEKHGDPMTIMDIPEDAPVDEKSSLFEMVANRGGEAAFALPKKDGGAEVAQYGVKIVEAVGRSFDSFNGHLGKTETDIAVLILGQNLTTEVSGDTGSRAAAQVHKSVALVKRREDATIATVFREQGLTHWAAANFGDPELAPRPCYDVEDPEDELSEAQTLEALGHAVTALQLAGFRVDVEAVAQKYGIPVEPLDDVESDDDVTSGAGAKNVTLTPSAVAAVITVNEARAAAGYGPLLTDTGAPNPDGKLSVAEFQAKYGHVIADAAKAEGGTAPGTEPVAPPPPRPGQPGEPPAPRAAPADEAPVRALAQPHAGPHVRTLVRTAAGKARAASYVDALQRASKRRAAEALAVDLAGLSDEIRKARDFKELKRRVLARYKTKLSATALAKVIEKANIMAHMDGRLSALEDL